MADVLLVARLLHSLPSVFAVSGTPRDVDKIVASLRAVVVARKLDRPLRIHLLHALQFLCKLQTGTVSICEFEAAVAATDLAVCEHHIVQSLEELYAVLEEVVNYDQQKQVPLENVDSEETGKTPERVSASTSPPSSELKAETRNSIPAPSGSDKVVVSPIQESEGYESDNKEPLTPTTPDSVFGDSPASCAEPNMTSPFVFDRAACTTSTSAWRRNYSRSELLSFRNSTSSVSEPVGLPAFLQCTPPPTPPFVVATPVKRRPRASSFICGMIETKCNHRTRSAGTSSPDKRSRADIVDRWEHDMYDPNQ